jgi:prephenate dehydrogenase
MLALSDMRVTIVGLGLMGGSLALALRPFVSFLAGVDDQPASVAAALEQGVVQWATTDLAEGIRAANLLILATPARAIVAILADLPRLKPAGGLVMDLGSTKGDICQAMSRLPAAFQAIGGHPMCGKERAGLAAAEPGLFRDRTFVLCRTARGGPAIEQVGLELISAIGGRPRFLEPAQHDQIVAAVSHWPFLLAALLIERAAELKDDEPETWNVSASGFRDATRLAGSDTAMMLDILLTNRQALLQQYAGFEQSMAAIGTLLAAGDEEPLFRWLKQRQAEYQSYLQEKGQP